MAKDKIKISDFTGNDKANLLEIFVNNHQILLKMCDMIFPSLRQQTSNGQVLSSKQANILNSLTNQKSHTGTNDDTVYTDLGASATATQLETNSVTPPQS